MREPTTGGGAAIEPGRPPHPVSARALLMLCLAFFFWTFFPYLTQYNLGPFQDMLENHGWGIRWQWGNSKHPPLFGWISAAWFSVFPRTDLSYRFLAALNMTASIGVMLLIARRFLAPEAQEVAVLVSLTLILLSFFAVYYNANSAMLPFWAGTVLFYLRVIERRRMADAVFLGLCAAAAMLCKYYSVVLFAALLCHALSHRRTRAIAFSPLALLTACTFALGIAGHVFWLFANDFSPIVFAARQQGDDSLANQFSRQVEFFLAQIGYALPGLLIMGLLRRPGDGAPLFDIARFRRVTGTLEGQVLLWAGIATVPITMVFGAIAQSPLTSTWSLPLSIFTPILLVLLLPERIAQSRRRSTMAITVGYVALLMALSPVIWAHNLRLPYANAAVPIAELARKAEQAWLGETGTELRFAAGETYPAYALSFYGSTRPQVLTGFNIGRQPWISPDDIAASGVLVACFMPDCIDRIGRRARFTITPLGAVEAAPPRGAQAPDTFVLHLWIARPVAR